MRNMEGAEPLPSVRARVSHRVSRTFGFPRAERPVRLTRQLFVSHEPFFTTKITKNTKNTKGGGASKNFVFFVTFVVELLVAATRANARCRPSTRRRSSPGASGCG